MFESQYNYVPNPYPPRDMSPACPGPYPYPGPPPGPHPGPWPGPIPPAPIQIDPSLSIPGAAADAYVTGKLLASKLGIDKLIGSIQLVNDKLEILGIDAAANGQVPSKGEDGSIEWVDAARESEVNSIREDLQNQLTQLKSELTTAQSNIAELFTVNAQQNTSIADLTELVNALQSLIEGDSENPGLQQRVEALETNLATKLDTEVFNEVINGPDGVIRRLGELETCCDDVHQILDDLLQNRLPELEVKVDRAQDIADEANAKADIIHNQLVQALGDPAEYPEYYENPVYVTLNELKNMDIDGGDIDEEVGP